MKQQSRDGRECPALTTVLRRLCLGWRAVLFILYYFSITKIDLSVKVGEIPPDMTKGHFWVITPSQYLVTPLIPSTVIANSG